VNLIPICCFNNSANGKQHAADCVCGRFNTTTTILVILVVSVSRVGTELFKFVSFKYKVINSLIYYFNMDSYVSLSRISN
jgi:hypothetical protein